MSCCKFPSSSSNLLVSPWRSIRLYIRRSTQISTRPRATKLGRVKCRSHVLPIQRSNPEEGRIFKKKTSGIVAFDIFRRHTPRSHKTLSICSLHFKESDMQPFPYMSYIFDTFFSQTFGCKIILFTLSDTWKDHKS